MAFTGNAIRRIRGIPIGLPQSRKESDYVAPVYPSSYSACRGGSAFAWLVLMLGQDSDNLKSFIGDATAFRTSELAKGKPVSVTGLTMQFADGRTATLEWSTGNVDTNGNTLPPDWIVTVNR